MVEEDRGRRELRVYPQPVHMLAQVRGGPEVVELSGYLEGKVGQQVHFPNVPRPETLPKRPQTRRLQAVTGQVPLRETIMRWYRHRGMDLSEEYMRCHCGRELETYENFMRCERYRGMEGPLVRDEDIPLLKKGEKGRREMERELGKEGHRKGLWHMVILKSLWRGLHEHTVAPEVMAHKPLRRTVEHLQERMACREAQLEARAEDMRDPVTKRVEMALTRYNPQVTMMEVRPQPDWRLRQSEGARDGEEREGDQQSERLMAYRQKRVRQVLEQEGTRGEAEVRWRPVGRQLVAGRLGPGGARAKGHPMLELEHPGRGVVLATGRERPGRKAETRRWSPGLEHPGQAMKTGTWARGTKAHREGGRQPGPTRDGVRAKEAAGEG